jgi:hypothetical protein
MEQMAVFQSSVQFDIGSLNVSGRDRCILVPVNVRHHLGRRIAIIVGRAAVARFVKGPSSRTFEYLSTNLRRSLLYVPAFFFSICFAYLYVIGLSKSLWPCLIVKSDYATFGEGGRQA